MKTLITAAILLASLNAAAESAKKGCLSNNRVKWITQTYQISLGEYPDYCDPDNRHYQMVETLMFQEDLVLNGPRARAPFNQEIMGYDFDSRLSRLAPQIIWAPSTPDYWRTCGTSAAAAAGPYPFRLGKMWICPLSFNSSRYMQSSDPKERRTPPVKISPFTKTSLLDLIRTLQHEARHVEAGGQNNGFLHVSCPRSSTGHDCDSSISYRGAYAVSMEAMAKIGVSATNIHPSTSFIAKRLAYITATDKFRLKTVEDQKNQHVILLTEKTTGRRLIFNYRYHSSAGAHVPKGPIAEISSISYAHLGPVLTVFPLYNLDHPESAEENDGSFDAELKGSFLNDVWSKATPEERLNFKDSASGDMSAGSGAIIWGDRILIRSFDRLDDKSQNDEIRLPEGKPVRFRHYIPDAGGKYVVESDQGRLFTITPPGWVDKDLKVAEFPNRYPDFVQSERTRVLDKREAYDKRRDDWLNKNWKNKKLIKAGYPEKYPEDEYVTYWLHKDGRLFMQQVPGEEPYPVRETLNLRFEDMTTSFNYDPKLPEGLN